MTANGRWDITRRLKGLYPTLLKGIYLLQNYISFAVNKYLQTVASIWIFINIE